MQKGIAAVIEALISVSGALVVCLINNYYQQQRFEEQQQIRMKEAERKHEETIRIIEYKLNQLAKKVDLHNNAVERLYIVEKGMALTDEKLKVANHRIDDLEKIKS